jgi:hypothetical protein
MPAGRILDRGTEETKGMGLLSKLELPASGAKPGKVTIAGADATDRRRTRLDLDDDDDIAAEKTPTPVATPVPKPTVAAPVANDSAADAEVMQAVSVGDVDQIAKSAVRFRKDGTQKVFDRPIGAPFESSKAGQGNRHNIVINGFSSLFGKPAVAGKPAPGDYAVTAYSSAEMGGDTFEGTLNIAAP